MDEIITVERQLMLWEKKIQLEKETQAALDPEGGQSEAKSMEKEIHRMKLRYETLQRDQEKMIKEMERAVLKREAITTKNRGRKSVGLTVAQMRKKMKSLRKQVKNTRQEVTKLEVLIRE